MLNTFEACTFPNKLHSAPPGALFFARLAKRVRKTSNVGVACPVFYLQTISCHGQPGLVNHVSFAHGAPQPGQKIPPHAKVQTIKLHQDLQRCFFPDEQCLCWINCCSCPLPCSKTALSCKNFSNESCNFSVSPNFS